MRVCLSAPLGLQIRLPLSLRILTGNMGSRPARSQAVLRRAARIEDIAEQVVMFCRAESVTGQVLVIDGGMPGGMH